MTHLERFHRVINRQTFDRIVFETGGTPEMWDTMKAYLGVEDGERINYELFDQDTRWAFPAYIGPENTRFDDGTYLNMWGVRMRTQSYGNGSYEEVVQPPMTACTSVREIEQYAWPSPDWYDYAKLPEQMAKHPDYPFKAGYAAIGWWSWEMRGMECFLEDLLTEPEIAEAIVEQVSDFSFQYYQRLLDACRDYIGKNFVAIHLSDDWATQESLLISPATYRQFFKKHYQRIIDLAHSAGLLVEYHCCGAVRDLIPDLIDTGIDILNPIQTSAAGMVPHELKALYGQDLVFCGGVDVQTILPFGTVDEVKREVKYLLDTLGENGGYILGPSHAIQVGTPPENVVAMAEAMFEYYGMECPLHSGKI